ncbi:T9SS type A sorting domain-containing protein [Bacteroidota bacterium]
MKNLIRFLILLITFGLFNLMPKVSFAQVQTGSFIFEGILRDYKVFLPQNYNGMDKLPLVFNLHGITLSAQQQMDYSQMNTVADTAGFIVVYPNAVYASWNCGISYVTHNVNDVGFFCALIDTLASHYSIDEEKIYVCGFSLGGCMSNRLACELSNRITAIATVSGTMAESIASTCNPGHPVPVLLIHGTSDLIWPYNGAYDWLSVEELITHWNNLSLCTESDTTSLPDLDTLDGCTIRKIIFNHCLDSSGITLIQVLQGGHSWPGGDKSKLHLPWGTIGKTNGDINASELIWNFFKNYKLTAPTVVKYYIKNPVDYLISQNYPNPFNPTTKIKYSIPKQSKVTMRVFDVLGRELSTLVNKEQSQGNYEVEFDGKGLPSGIYIYRLQTGVFVDTKKMIYIK